MKEYLMIKAMHDEDDDDEDEYRKLQATSAYRLA
jgi:hypothetical protein